HQDGLVHISQLADRFVEDPREVVKAGQVVKVKVVSIDVARQRIALTMKMGERVEGGVRPEGGGGERRGGAPGGGHRGGARPGQRPSAPAPRDYGPKQGEAAANPFAAQLAKLGLRKN